MRRGGALLCLLAAVLAGPIVAQVGDAPAAGVRTLFSTSRRFAISGLSGVDAITLGRWAEDVAERLERTVGQPIPFEAADVIIVRALPAAATARPGVEIVQGYFDGRLQQKLVLARPAECDQEDVLEGLTHLLVNRLLVVHQAPSARQQQAANAPAWLSIGLAQNLFKELRARNGPLVLQLLEENQLPAATELLDLQVLPPGRWREKYCSGLLVSWLMAQPDARARWGALFLRLAAGDRAGEAVRGGFLRLSDGVALEREWRRWVEQQQQIVFDPGERSQLRERELAGLLQVRPADFGITATNAPARLAAADLIARRGEKWVGPLARAVALKTALLAAGQPPEFQKAAEAIHRFYDDLARAAGEGGWFTRRPGADTLQRRLGGAELALAQLRARREEQDRYVNALDHWMQLQQSAEGADAARPAPAGGGAPDAAAQRYLDEIERALPAGP